MTGTDIQKIINSDEILEKELVHQLKYNKNMERTRVQKWFYPKSHGQQLYRESNFIKDMRNGSTLEYYPDGTLKARLNFKDDKLDGEQEWYYPSGKLRFLCYYKDGLKHGILQEFSENRTKAILIESYKNGVLDGIRQYYPKRSPYYTPITEWYIGGELVPVAGK